MILPKSFTEVTPLSRALGVGLYFVLAFGGVWLGAKLVNVKTQTPKVVYVEKPIRVVEPIKEECGAFSAHIGSGLEDGIREVGEMKWSPDCRYVAFVVMLVGRDGYVIRRDDKLGVYVYDSKTTQERQVFKTKKIPDDNPFGLRWEGSRILVFTDNAGMHMYDLNMGRVLPYEQYVRGTVEMVGVLRLRKKTGPDDLAATYEIMLDKPFYDQDVVSEFLVADRTGLERMVGKRVRLEGEIGWGYGESRYLDVRKASLL